MDAMAKAREALKEAIDFKQLEVNALVAALNALSGNGAAPETGTRRGPKASADQRQAVYAALAEVDSIKGVAMTTGIGPRIVGAALRDLISASEVLLEKGKYKIAPPATV